MPLTIEVTNDQKARLWSATVRDSEFPGIVTTFTYEEVDGGLETTALGLVGYRVKADPTTVGRHLSRDMIRDLLPWRWEKAAKLRTYLEKDRNPSRRSELRFKEGDDEVVVAGEPIRSRARVDAIQRLRQVAKEYEHNVMSGIPDPVGAIARKHGVKPATARAWVHRARKQGLLGPAPGRTAGEADRTAGQGGAE